MAGVSPQEIEYQEAHITDDASAGLYASSITMMIVTATTVVLRLLCKKKLNAKITPDDFCTIFALVRCPLGPSGSINRTHNLLIKSSFLSTASASNSYSVGSM